MNESTNYLMYLILYTALILTGIKYRYYKEKSERLQMENIELAKKLGKPIGVCQYCKQPLVMNNPNHKYHTECSAFINSQKVAAMYKAVKRRVKRKVIVLRNGLEVLNNVVGKEIGQAYGEGYKVKR